MNRLNYYWRVVATGLCFATFSIGGLIFSFLVIPVVSLISKDATEKRRRTRHLIHLTLRFFTRMMSVLGVIEFDIREAGQVLRNHHGKVVIANHPSLIDVVVLISLMPHADCIVKNELWDNPYIGQVLRASQYINNSGDVEQLISACKQSLDEGYSLIIFPEGTRTTPGEALVLQRGASNIALRCKAPLVPVLINCEPATLTKNEKWYSVPPTKVKFSLRVDDVIDTVNFEVEKPSVAIRARHLTAQIQNYYITSLKRYG
ncbi:MAG: lysophospholipid acyltransferase family protein [Pseudomonadota bacterium]